MNLAIDKSMRLSAADERKYARRYQRTKDPVALANLVLSCTRLVLKLAAGYARYGVEFEELVCAGHEGLVIGCQRFDPDRGNRLSTFVCWWIKARMLEHLYRCQGPVNAGKTKDDRDLFRKLRRAVIEIEQRGGTANPEALAKWTGKPEPVVTGMMMRLWPRDVKLDHPVTINGEPTNLRGQIASDLPSPEAQAEANERLSRFQRARDIALLKLSRREAAIVKERVLTESPRTLQAIGDECGLSRERIRQIEHAAMFKFMSIVREEMGA